VEFDRSVCSSCFGWKCHARKRWRTIRIDRGTASGAHIARSGATDTLRASETMMWIATGVLLYLVALTRAYDRRLQKSLRQTSGKVAPLRALFFRAAQRGLFLLQKSLRQTHRKVGPLRALFSECGPLCRRLWETLAGKARTSPRYERSPATTEPDEMSTNPPVTRTETRAGAEPPSRRSFVYGGLRKTKMAESNSSPTAPIVEWPIDAPRFCN